MSFVIAVDVGGTFTDLVLLDRSTGEARFGKVLTTPKNPADGVLAAVESMGIDLREAEAFLHGTTIGLNAVLERRTRTVGLITTKGFRDVLEIGRMTWPMYHLVWDQPEPLVPRHLRHEVSERVLADGTVDIPLAAEDVRRAGAALVADDVHAIAVCLLHSYRRPDHENLCAQILHDAFPEVEVSLSHEVSGEHREFERTATTVIDAALKPIMSRYLRDLETRLGDLGFKGRLLITRCDGGVMSVEEACQKSVRTLVSGPASGVMGASALAKALNEPRVIACDMGGTSFDAALILDGKPELDSITHVEGIPLLVPVVRMTAVGAGGGSIAWIDGGGALNFGPESAGADPGPVCYGRGGTRPTFTDAAVVAQLIDYNYFLGGTLTLDPEAARKAIENDLVAPLGLPDVDHAAVGIIELAETKMAAALESITVELGLDPREFVLVAFGGGGPIAAAGLAKRLGIPRVVIPESPGTFSARGMTTLDMVYDFSKTSVTSAATMAPALEAILSELKTSALEVFDREAVPAGDREMHSSLDARYENQEHTITLPLPSGEAAIDASDVRRAFDNRHEALYSYRMDDPIEAVTFRVRAVGRRGISIVRPAVDRAASGASKGKRTASHPVSGRHMEWTVYERNDLKAGTAIEGPAIVEEPSATTLVHKGQTLSVDNFGNLLIDTSLR